MISIECYLWRRLEDPPPLDLDDFELDLPLDLDMFDLEYFEFLIDPEFLLGDSLGRL